MNRNRRSVSKTPVQKTNLLHFFQRTPSSASLQGGCTPLVSDPITGTPSSSSQNSSVTPFLTKVKPPIECPGCNKVIPFYRLNQHLDRDCVTSLKTEDFSTHQPKTERIIDLTVPELDDQQEVSHTPIKANQPIVVAPKLVLYTPETSENRAGPEIISPKKLDFSSPPSTPTTPRKETQRKFQSSTKRVLSARQKEVAVQTQKRQAITDFKKFAETHPQNQSLAEVKKKLLFSEEGNNSKPSYEGLPYYLETFHFLLKSTFDEPLHQHLFCEEDRNLHNTFKSLSLDAQKLYVRLFSRKFQWRRREKIAYDDIAADLTPALNELCSSSLLLGIEQLEDLSILMGLLTQPEVKQLFKESKIPFNGKGNALQAFLKHSRDQPCLVGGSLTMVDRMIIKLKRNYIKECYKLSDGPRRTFLQLILLSTLHQRQEEEEEKGQQQQSFKMLQVKIGEKSFPSYRIRRQRAIFQHRDHFLRYGEACLLELQVRESYERKQWANLIEQTDGIQQFLSEYTEKYRLDDLELPLFLRRYTAGSVYVYVLNKRIEALQCLKKYPEAVSLIRMLISQDVYLPTHRGHWYERLALNVEQHLKEPMEALEVIKNGLNDEWVTPAHRFALSQRAIRICTSPKWKQKLESLLNDLPLLKPAEPRSVIITGRPLPRDLPGHKSMFIREDLQSDLDASEVTLCSVEELVLQHYIANGYTHGVHGEGSTLWTVIGLLFWDIIYQSDVADVFLSPFQALPLDFDTLDFYQSRQEVLEKRLELIRSGSSDQVLELISQTWNENHGKTSLVSWDRFRDLEHIEGLVQCISPTVLASISHRLLQNYRHYRSGFPDLTIWNPQDKKWRIIEVKGPNDRLSPKQTLWLDFLVSLGVEAEVCHVEAVGARRLERTPQVAIKSKSPRSVEVDNEDNSVKVGRQSRRLRARRDDVDGKL